MNYELAHESPYNGYRFYNEYPLQLFGASMMRDNASSKRSQFGKPQTLLLHSLHLCEKFRKKSKSPKHHPHLLLIQSVPFLNRLPSHSKTLNASRHPTITASLQDHLPYLLLARPIVQSSFYMCCEFLPTILAAQHGNVEE